MVLIFKLAVLVLNKFYRVNQPKPGSVTLVGEFTYYCLTPKCIEECIKSFITIQKCPTIINPDPNHLETKYNIMHQFNKLHHGVQNSTAVARSCSLALIMLLT